MLQKTEFIWLNGTLTPWDQAQTHVLTHTLHYGGGVFEGIRVYATPKGPGIFRLREHLDRLFYSAAALSMVIPFTQEELRAAIVETVKKNKLTEGYIRPLVYYGYGIMGINPVGAPVDVMIACWPWGKYLPHDAIDVKVSSHIRIHPKSTIADAKIVGHYVNSMLAILEVRGTRYQEALLLDFEGNVAEGPAENFFMIKNGEIITPARGTILPGITRDTVFKIAASFGIKTREAVIPFVDAQNADEAFFTGTAAEITPIRSLDDVVLGGGTVGPITKKIQQTYHQAVRGELSEFAELLTVVD